MFFLFYLKELEAENQINTQNFRMEEEKAKSRIKILENAVENYKEEEENRSRKMQAIMKEVFKPSQVLASIK